MLEQVLQELHNWFQTEIYHGEYTIQDGGITLPFLKEGQYYRVMGSVFNDGLHQYDTETDTLTDETFTGTVWALAVPRAVIELADEIAGWNAKYNDTVKSPYVSESFGGYTYTKATSSGNSTGGWEAVFRSRLNQWRKLREI